MQNERIFPDSHFNASVVAEGARLTFLGYAGGVAGGAVVRRYKDPDGNFGTESGGLTAAEAEAIARKQSLLLG